MKKILFVCIENSNRSQMAEAFAKIYGLNTIESFSAGSKPSGKINAKAITAMKELNYNLAAHSSISIEEFRNTQFDYVITMGCGDACPFIAAKFHIDWNIPDPKNLNATGFNEVRDLIGEKVNTLIKTINDKK